MKYSVFLLPILFLWAGFNMHLAKYFNDPDYVYLVNATAICNGNSPGYFDHPGTTVMQIGAITIALKHYFSNPENETLVRHVLKDPHMFILSIRNVFLVLNAIILLFLGLVALKKTRSIWLALLLQVSTFITTSTLDHIWTKVSPASMLFFITCIYVIAILWYYAEKEKNSWKFVIIFALITGAGLGTKATFFPMVIFPLIVLPTFKKKLLFVAGLIPSFVFFTIPIIPAYKNMYYWFRRLTSHTGIYGQGDKGFIDTESYTSNILKIFENNPIFGIVTGIGILVLVVTIIQKFQKRKSEEFNWDILFLTGLVATLVVGILMVAKHYHGDHYLIPVLLLIGITFYFALKIVIQKISGNFVKSVILPVIVVGLIIFLVWRQPPILKGSNNGYKISNIEIDSTNTMLNRDYPGYTRINYYTISLNKFSALKFGDVYTKQLMSPYLIELYPETYFYSFNNNQFEFWNIHIQLEDIVAAHGNKILMVNGPVQDKTAEEMGQKGIPLKNIYKGRIQTIYVLDTLKYKEIIKAGI